MNYLIHNLETVCSDIQQQKIRMLIEEHIRRIGKVINNHSKVVAMDLYFSREDNTLFMISSIINLDGEIFYFREKGNEIAILFW